MLLEQDYYCGQTASRELLADMKILIVLLFSLLTLGAADLKLSWDANTDPVVGYRVYQAIGTNAFLKVGDTNVTTFLVTNVPAAQTNRFFVTAYNSANLESGPSAIVQGVVPFPPTNLTATAVITLSIPLK